MEHPRYFFMRGAVLQEGRGTNADIISSCLGLRSNNRTCSRLQKIALNNTNLLLNFCIRTIQGVPLWGKEMQLRAHGGGGSCPTVLLVSPTLLVLVGFGGQEGCKGTGRLIRVGKYLF